MCAVLRIHPWIRHFQYCRFTTPWMHVSECYSWYIAGQHCVLRGHEIYRQKYARSWKYGHRNCRGFSVILTDQRRQLRSQERKRRSEEHWRLVSARKFSFKCEQNSFKQIINELGGKLGLVITGLLRLHQVFLGTFWRLWYYGASGYGMTSAHR